MTSKRFIYFILAAFITGSLLLLVVEYNSAKNIRSLITGNQKLQNELRLHNQLREMERDLLGAEIKIRGAVAANDSTFLDSVDVQIAEAKRYLDSLRFVSEQDSTKRNINQLYAIADEKLNLKNQILDSFRLSGRLSSQSFKIIQQRRKLTNVTNFVSRKIFDSRQRLIDSLSISISNSGRNARQWGSIMIVVVLLSGATLMWFIIFRIQRQNQLIHQLDASEKKVREVSRIKENFMANMSHEIRTPMNAILGFTHLLKSRIRDPELSEFVQSIRKSGENLLTIINDILDLSKIEAGMMRIETAPFSVKEIIHSVRILFREKIEEKKLEFMVDVDKTIPDMLLGDATRLTQILVNMVGNAIKFTPQGSIHLGICNKGVTGNQIRIGFIISDSGIGIEKEKLSTVFERFRQSEDSITRQYGGTGLGLSIVKDLIELQKGEISVESTKGLGTTFRFVIPYEIATGVLNVSDFSGSASFVYPKSEQVHILVVEDNEMNRNLLKHLLNEWNLSFDMVQNGAQALEKLERKHYDLILMDIQMPVMDGYTATREIRSRLKRDIPIVAMTAHAFAGEREKCLNVGMNEYITKPLNEKELNRIITRIIGLSPVTSELKEEAARQDNARYQFINLQYMREISGGDKRYEKKVTEQFFEAITADLDALESAFSNQDLPALRHTAHNMKTNISVMGLSEKLQSYLDEIEYDPFDETHFHQLISSVNEICLNALPEARHFYSTI
jgi:signal transduction histidine kinase/CheY-like chemotaxis protein